MKEAIRLSRCVEIIKAWKGKEPLASHLRKYFHAHRNMGSTDRRITRGLVYAYYRLGKAMEEYDINTRIAVAAFIYGGIDVEMERFLAGKHTTLPAADPDLTVEQRFEIAATHYRGLGPGNIFPWTGLLSDGINREEWLSSFLRRPLTWARTRKGFEPAAELEFKTKKIPFVKTELKPSAFGFEPETDITSMDVFREGKMEIQDLSSQLTGKFFTAGSPVEPWWDCCAGSGGKTLLLLDMHPSVTLTVSDIRESILRNLRERLHKAGYVQVNYMKADLAVKDHRDLKFGNIILDAPCTGSGTWNRTPEMMSVFNEGVLHEFVKRQQAILSNIRLSLIPGGRIIYITCSVFSEENEGIVNYAVSNLQLKVVVKEIISGTPNRADTMFVAVLQG